MQRYIQNELCLYFRNGLLLQFVTSTMTDYNAFLLQAYNLLLSCFPSTSTWKTQPCQIKKGKAYLIIYYPNSLSRTFLFPHPRHPKTHLKIMDINVTRGQIHFDRIKSYFRMTQPCTSCASTPSHIKMREADIHISIDVEI